MATPVTLTMDGTLLNWLKKVGDAVNKGDIIAEVEADKATVEIEAPESGVISALNAQLGDSIKAGTDIAMIGEGVAQPASAATPQPVVKAAEPSAPAGAAARSNGAPAPAASLTDDGRVKVSPIARKIAEERGIDLRQVAGSGPGGRIVKEDV
ncbi:MAG: E3 binding domain-containing protein, partial [Anaerolineae bacterium]|nr:E3 binding domain-containing protein [Anaerolineae bacterium]